MTIAAFLSKRLQADWGAFSDLTIASSGLDVQGYGPSPKRKRKHNKLKSGPGTDGGDHATGLVPPTCEELMEANNEEGNIVSKTHLSTSKSSRSAVVQKAVGWNVASDAVEVATAVSPKPAPDPRCPAQSPVFESEVEGADSIEADSVQMKVDPGLARYSEGITATLRTFATKAQSMCSGSEERMSTEAIPAIPKELEISEVHVKGHGEGSSSDKSSTEGEAGAGAVPSTRRDAFVIATSVPTRLVEDQLTALIRGPEKRNPHKSVLDEIPSSSETGDETTSEDLNFDEENLSRQPSRKQMKVLSMTPMEPEATSDDEDITSLSVYMDTSHVIPPHSSVSLSLREVSRGC
jgi:hypothetical protein